jgi:hypothetical protein
VRGGGKRRSNTENYLSFQAISSVSKSVTGCSCSAERLDRAPDEHASSLDTFWFSLPPSARPVA